MTDREKVTPIRPPSNGVSTDTPRKREHEDTKSHVLVSSILGAPNLTTDKKIEALASVLGHAFSSPSETQPPGSPPPNKPSWYTILGGAIICFSLLGDFASGLIPQETNEVLAEVQALRADMDVTLDNIEDEIILLQVSQNQQNDAFTAYVLDSSEWAELPDSVQMHLTQSATAKQIREEKRRKRLKHDQKDSTITDID